MVKIENVPQTFALDPRALAQNKSRVDAAEPTLQPALEQLLIEADHALREGPWSVMDKPVVPPSGDKHDYLSLARYYWRNPTTPDGLPYIQRDGQVNPEIFDIPDHKNFDAVMVNVATLALAFFLTRAERYAEHATRVMRVWFLDLATRMNPHLDFAQGIRGINTGRGIGIIETRELAVVVDALGLLGAARAWTETDQRGMVDWCARFRDWLSTSNNGRTEAQERNNHGTFYQAQIAALALFTDHADFARQVLTEMLTHRLAWQIEPDGRQPLELARTLSWHYSIFNLQAWFRIAALGERVGLDVWNYATRDGRSLRAALDFLTPFARGAEWTHQQIAPREFGVLCELLLIAALKYRDARYREIACALPNVNVARHRVNLQI